jgi:ferrous iron transport protein B
VLVTEPVTTTVTIDRISVRRHPTASIAVLGNPNCGKSTVFNRLTGMRQKTGNYPGVTVEKHVGLLRWGDSVLELIDLPGTFGLSAFSLEERTAVDVVLGRIPGTNRPDGILAVVDATHLYQGLYLVQQLMELDLPMVVALSMTDAAAASGIRIDLDKLAGHLNGVAICPVVATTGQGVNQLRAAVAALPDSRPIQPPIFWPALHAAAEKLAADAGGIRRIEMERALVDGTGGLYDDVTARLISAGIHRLERAQQEVFGDQPPLAAEARRRYSWVREVMSDVQKRTPVVMSLGQRVRNWLNRPVPGTIGLFVVMAVVFQAVFAWATPMMEAIDAGATALGHYVESVVPAGALASFLSDGVIAGVGSVIVFLPQILILFLFIILLEDSGYLARAAYLMDRTMRSVGLSGQSIIPMISSFACAVPGIMATRVIPDRRDRIATILAAPFMTCSARLPVYALLIAAFIPRQAVGLFNLQGLVLLGLYLLGILGGLLTALLLKKTALHGPKPAFALMLPEFRKPNLRTVLTQLMGRVVIFLKRAGTVIFSVAVIVWALAYYPRSDEIQSSLVARQQTAALTLRGEALQPELQRIENHVAALQLEQSFLGRAGKLLEPMFRPLGWDWKVSAAVIAGFPAREVVVAVLGTVYAVGGEADDATLSGRLAEARRPDGSRVYTLPMVFGLLVFYVFCLQCAATLAVIRRETNGWRWPVFAWFYMTSIGYFGAMIIYQLGSA